MAATVQNVKHSAIVGLYISNVYTAVVNAAVQPDTSISFPVSVATSYLPVENAPKTQLS